MWRIRFSFLFLFLLFRTAMPDEPLATWTGADLSLVQYYAAKGLRAGLNPAPDILTPSGQPAIQLELIDLLPESKPWDIQLKFVYPGDLKAGVRYEMRFMCKANTPGQIQWLAAKAESPFTPLSGGIASFEVTTQWEERVLILEPAQTAQGPLALPRLMLAKYGGPAMLHFGPVTLRAVPKPVPFSLDKEWTIFIYADEPGSFAELPIELGGPRGPVTGRQVSLTEGRLNLRQLAGTGRVKDRAVLFNEFHCSNAGIMRIGFAADWWLELYLNGEKVYGNLPAGNGGHRFSTEDHVLDIPVRAGKNLLAASVLSGSEGWLFVIGPGADGAETAGPWVAKPGPAWKPVDGGTKEKWFVQPGTALDFSQLTGRRLPAGTLGRLQVSPDGSLCFSGSPERPLRFFGFNTWALAAVFSKATKEELRTWAEAMAVRGYNMIRFQAVDVMFQEGPRTDSRGFEPYFNDEQYDRFDYLLSCLKENGIYFNIDLMTSSRGYQREALASSNGFQTQLFFNPVYRAHWETAVNRLMNHRNPYTGTCLKDETALAIVEPFNEQDLRLADAKSMSIWSARFHAELRARYGNEDALRQAWGDPNLTFATLPMLDEALLRRGDASASAAGDFLITTMEELTDWYLAAIRRSGYPGLVTQWDMIMRTLELPARTKMPVIAQHTYFAHPNYIPAKGLVKKSPDCRWFLGGMDKDMLIEQESSLGSSYFRAAAAIRFLDRPFIITEHSHSAPNRFRHERGLYFGAYASLQGWAALHSHETTVPLWPAKWYENRVPPLTTFDHACDPVSRASEVVSYLAFQRGDVKQAPHAVELALKGTDIFPKNYLAAIGDDYAKLSMLTRIGCSFSSNGFPDGTRTAAADITLKPAEFSPLNVSTWYATASARDGAVFAALLGQLRAGGILPSSNRSDYGKRLYESETGELLLDGLHETMTVVTPCLEGAILKKDAPFVLGRLTIDSCSRPASVVLASIDARQELDRAKRMLLVLSTDALNQGMVFEDKNRSLCVEIGGGGILMETVKISLRLATRAAATFRLYALSLDGRRAEAIPCEVRDGLLHIRINTGDLKFCTPFFELEAGPLR